MSLTSFIPEIWSAKLMQALEAQLRYAQPGVMNRDYEGEIRNVGDTVHINSIGPITINDYVRNTDMANPQELQDASATLQITQQKSFNFQVDDLDAAQMKVSVMSEAMRRAAYGLASVADAYVGAMAVAGASPANAIGSDGAPVTPTAATAYDYLIDLSVKLDNALIPEEGRYVIIPPWYRGLLAKDDRFTHATATGDSIIRNGRVGTVAGFDIVISTNVPNTANTKYKILAGTNWGVTYAEQVNKVEGYRPEKRFADAVKGLHMYGAKVIRPEALAVMTANPS